MDWTQQQQQVIDTRGRNILVSAAAGSGKTAVLVERIISRITDRSNPIDIDRILIVTFTRAAAGQMRERISKAIEDRLSLEPDNARLRRQALLIHNAQINTIHGFCSYLIRSYFHTINLDPGYRMADEGELMIIKEDAVISVLEDEYDKKTDEFISFVEAFSPGKSDDALRKNIIKLYDFSQSHPWPQVWLEECNELYSAKTPDELFAMPFMEKNFWSMIDARVREAEDGFIELLRLCRTPGGPWMYEEAILSDLDFIDSISGSRDYDYICEKFTQKFARLPSKKDENVNPELRESVKERRDALKKRLTLLGKKYFDGSKAGAFKTYRAVAPHIRTFTELVLSFTEEFKKQKRRKNILDFSDLEHLALEILAERSSDGEVKLKQPALDMQKRFEEVMVDEYQDSNLIQEYILNLVSHQSMDNRFMVGDVKQSIYRFRMARPELFVEKLSSPDFGMRIDLHKNFRSRESVIDFVNLIFRQCMVKELGNVEYDRDAELFYGADFPKSEDKNTEIILLDISDNEDADAEEPDVMPENIELEARAAAERINLIVGVEYIRDGEEYRPARYEDCVILLRTLAGWADTFVKVLTDMGIPANTTSRRGYFSAREITWVMNYLRICDNPLQDIPFAAVLTSPMGGFTTQEMALIRIENKDVCLYRALTGFGKSKGDLSKKVYAFLETYHEIRQSALYTSVHEIIKLILEKTGFGDYALSMPGGSQRMANLDMLVEKAISFENSSLHGLFSFVRYIEQLNEYDVDYGEAGVIERQNSVRIMSIHKSKGLEFPIVLLCGMGKRINKTDSRDVVIMDADFGIGMDYVDAKNRVKYNSIIRGVLSERNLSESMGEELRILYVAMTRAKERLICIGTHKKLQKLPQKYMHLMSADAWRLPASLMAEANDYWDFILPSLFRHRSFEGVFEKYGRADIALNKSASKMFSEIYDAPADIDIYIINKSHIMGGELLSQTLKRLGREVFEKWDDSIIYDADIKAGIEERLDFVYPFEDLHDIPAKVSVSELKRSYTEDVIMLGKSLEDTREKPFELLVPAFVKKSEKEILSANRGVAYHKVLERLDMKKTLDEDGLRQQIEKLKLDGILDDIEIKSIRISDFVRFLSSNLAKRMKGAPLKREQPFVMSIPSDELNANWPKSETVLVQGIIDAFFVENGQIILVDYKTDRVTDAAILVQRYRMQLYYYAQALCRLTGMEVGEKHIYSFYLGEDILLT